MTEETQKSQKIRAKQEEIIIMKLEKEERIRKRNEEVVKKWEKLEKIEAQNKKE